MVEMDKLLFGPAGVPISSPKADTESGIKQVHRLGLECMELEFVQSVRMKPEKAQKVREIAQKLNIKLTVHAPYYINLNSKDKDKLIASKKRLLDAARIGSLAGAQSVVFHPAFYQKEEPQKVYQRVKEGILEVMETLHKEGIEIEIRPETTGKPTQFGTVEEIVRLSQEIEGVLPCVDFAHLHARNNGGVNTYEEFVQVLEFIERELGNDVLKNMHIHLSGINYGPKGERNHLNLKDSDMNFKDLLRALKDKGVAGFVISESPNLEEDALILKEIYHSL